MDPRTERNEGSHETSEEARRKGYSKLYVRFILLTLVCAVIPLLVAGWAVYHNYSEFSHKRMADYFQRRAEQLQLFSGRFEAPGKARICL